jgi:hypothetical protein
MDNTNKKERNTKIIALAITIALLLAASTYLYIDNNNVKELNVQQQAKIDTLTAYKAQLEQELASIKDELEIYRVKNVELDSQLTAKDDEIELKVKKIQRLISDNASLPRIKKEMEELRILNEQYIARIKELEERLLATEGERDTLKVTNSQLAQKVTVLQDENSVLTKKLGMAGVLRVENVIVIGEKKGKGGKYAPTKLKKAERFLVTFDLAENKLAESGEKTVYVTITDPSGKVMENRESGSFMNEDQNLSVPYTKMQTVSYGKQSQKVILPVDFDSNKLPAGKYKLEFYCDKFLAGTKTLTLK